MNFQEAIQSGFRNYVTFSGRAPRSAFWYWVLFEILVSIVASILDAAVFPLSDVTPLNAIASILLFLPSLAVSVRRLHDIDRTGWWVLISLTVIGIVLLIIWNCLRGTIGPNRFGPDPLAGKAS
ncbi:DUF805 domain-containing protein [Microbacteriaceae bacterium K1510]|nr:DUF805 domain-containing protein [Microbacteriaceae bacterium K1510]